MKPHYDVVFETLRQVLQPIGELNWSEATLLEADLGIDSGLMLELIMALEESIPGLVIDPTTLTYEQFESIGSVCEFVSTNLKEEVVL